MRILREVNLMFFLIMGLILTSSCGGEKKEQVSIRKDSEQEQKKGISRGEMVAKAGSKVKIQYIGTLKDGSVFDKSKEGEPLEFTVGNGQVIPGFNKAVEGMKLDEEKKITISADDAYGKRNEELVRKYPKDSAPENLKPEVGMVVSMRDPSGRTIPATITDVTEKDITLDLNHPLADNDLTFEIKVLSIE